MNPESSSPAAATAAAPIAASAQAPIAPVVGAAVPVSAPVTNSPLAGRKPRKGGFGSHKAQANPAAPKL